MSNGFPRSKGLHRSKGLPRSKGPPQSKGLPQSKAFPRWKGLPGSKGLKQTFPRPNGLAQSKGLARSKGLCWSKGLHRSKGLFGSNRPQSKGLLIESYYSLPQIKNHFQVGWMGSINNIYNLFWAQEIHNAMYTILMLISLIQILWHHDLCHHFCPIAQVMEFFGPVA